MSETALATVASFRDPWGARIAWGRLLAEDVTAYVIHEYHVWIDWRLSQALGGVKLQVPSRLQDEAVRILRALDSGEYADLLDDYEPFSDAGPCPRCGSGDFKVVFSLGAWFSLVFVWLITGIIFPARRNHNFCRKCGYLWDRDLKYDGRYRHPAD